MAKRKTPQAGARGRKPEASSADENLNSNQKLFCRDYARTGNGTSAYHLAYPEAGLRTCQQGSFDLLKKPEIQDFIQVIREERAQELKITREDLIRVYSAIAFNPDHKRQIEAADALWEKLGFGNAKNSRDRKSFLAGISEVGRKLGRAGEVG